MKTALQPHAQSQPRPAVAARAFTLIEIAISLGIIAFALVAIIGVLPTGMSYQRENREETIVNQDASILLNAIRNGERGLDDLTNYVFAITNYADLHTPGGAVVRQVRGYTYYGSSTTPSFPLTNGLRIIGLISTPRFVPDPSSHSGAYYSNYVVAFVRSISGPASEKFPQTNSSVQELGLSYRLVPSLIPYGTNWFDPSWTNYATAANHNEFVTRSNFGVLTRQYQGTMWDLRLTFRWPLLPTGQVPEGGSRQVYRSLIVGSLTNGIGYAFPPPLEFPPRLESDSVLLPTSSLRLSPVNTSFRLAHRLPASPGSTASSILILRSAGMGEALPAAATRSARSKVARAAAGPSDTTAVRPKMRIAANASPPLAAFTLMEILVTVGLLSFIVLGLLAMFNQTSRAFRSGMTQTDILETGRATMDMLSRELEQMYPSHQPTLTYPGTTRTFRCTNFFVDTPLRSDNFGVPWTQSLPGSSVPRMNFSQRFFFLTKLNQDIFGAGYMVLPESSNANIGTLYRVMVTNNARSAPITLSSNFMNAPFTTYSRIADGVVHLRVRPFAANGYEINADNPIFWPMPSPASTNAYYHSTGMPLRYPTVTNANAWVDLSFPENTRGTYFMNDAVPAYVEVELGLLEDRTLARLRSIPNVNNAQLQYLQNHAGQVHLFRQRIPIRNFDPAVYQ